MNSSIEIIEGFFPSSEKKIVSDQAFRYLEKTTQMINLLLSTLGVITNSINIRVFVQQGVRNSSTNLGLLALSAFDILSCFLLMAPFSCHIFTYYDNILLPYRICQTHANYATFLSVIFTYCSNWTTVYISLERTLCVVIPLKVKLYLRPRSTAIVITLIFAIFSTLQLLYGASTTIVWRFNSILNLTLPYASENAFAKKYLLIYSTLANTVLNSLAIAIVAINTTIMIYKLNQFKKWRNENLKTSGKSGQEEVTESETTQVKAKDKKSRISSKEVELVKSVTAVTCIFLVCLSMSHIPATVILVLPGVSITGINRNLMILVYTIRFGFSLLNSSINFFFYLRVSSRYREAFREVFPSCSGGKKA